MRPSVLKLLAALGCLTGLGIAQDVEPRRWTHLPVDTSVAGVVYAYTTGDLHFDPVLRINDVELEMHTGGLSCVYAFGLLGTTARLDTKLPFQRGRWEGLVNGQQVTVRRDGFADPSIRLSVNFVGAPPLRGEAFREYREDHRIDTVVGAGLAVRLPLGEYKKDKLINLGGNRFVIRPQLGVLHIRGPWSYELTGSVFLHSNNDEFFNGNTLQQDPLFALQAHVVRVFKAGLSVSGGVGYGWAGESEVNGANADDYKRNLLLGVTAGYAVSPKQTIQLAYVRGRTFEDVGVDSDSMVVAWSIRF